MSFSRWLTAIAVVSLPLGALAQQKQLPLHPGDANAPASAFTYESAFKNYQSATEPETTPDKAWRGANDEMGKLGGHVGHMKGNSPSTARKQSAAPAQKSAPVDHSKHH